MKIPVLLPNIFDHPFTYESDKKVDVGRYVLVPFGKNDAVGVVWDQFEKEKNNKKFKIKKIKKTFNVNKLNENSIKFLNDYGNPFKYNLVDKDGTESINLGAYGVPETFLVNKNRKILIKIIGPINDKDVKQIREIVNG